MLFEKFHKVGFAVIGECRHVIDSDVLVIVLFYILQYGFHFFERLRLGYGCGLFFLPVGNKQKEELKQESFDCKLVSFRFGVAQQVDLADAFGDILIIGNRRSQVCV